MNRKADFSAMKDMTLGLIVLIILIIILSNIAPMIFSTSEEKKCESYTTMASIFKYPITKDSIVNLNNACPTKNLVIRAEGQKKEDIEKNAADDALIEMYFCGRRWGYAYNEIKRNPFSQWNIDNACVVCSTIKFDKSFPTQELKGLFSRQADVTVPDGSGKTFFEYFTGNPPSSKDRSTLSLMEEGIDTTKEYYVIYSVNMGTSEESFWKWLGLGTAAGAGTGYVTKQALKPAIFLVSIFGKGKAEFVKKAIVGIGISSGVISGAIVGENRRDISQAAILIVQPDEIKNVCQTLGKDPLDGPWGELI